MRKVLFVDYDKCTGCRICEIYCSFTKTKTCNPARARLGILNYEEEGFSVPMICQQCEEAFCLGACPVKAISKDGQTGVVSINDEMCIGCRQCLAACPFGAISVDPIENKVFKCDLCQGDPWCARMCPTGAIKFLSVDQATTAKRVEAMKKFTGQMRVALGEKGGE